jgi:iron complex outermembrane receptor protein
MGRRKIHFDLVASCATTIVVGAIAASAQADSFNELSAFTLTESAATVPAEPAGQLGELSLEDLMNIEVTSVSRHKQKVSESAAAVSVISADDIERSGFHSIPEALRLVPGMDVARIDSHSWAISARGFNDQYANKLLVLMDGRTVYVPFFAGVEWDMQDYLMQDLDRIEVIRGPGATMWGANAVNGVINIQTKSAKDTQGLFVTGLGSNVDNLGALRYGGKIAEDTYYRIYGQFRKTEDFPDASGDGNFDGWQSTRGGFRVDHINGTTDTLTLEGEAYQNLFGTDSVLPDLAAPPVSLLQGTHYAGGQYILGRWTHTISEKSDYSLQMYYDRIFRQEDAIAIDQHTGDLEFQHRFPLGNRQSVIWGVGGRFISDFTTQTAFADMDPGSKQHYRLMAFAQDEIAIVPERFSFIVGSKFEYSSYSDFEYQPSGRLLWTPNDKNTVWAAVSRAVHTPTRDSQDGDFFLQAMTGPGGVPVAIHAVRNRDQESEDLLAYELGYRVKPTEQLSFDIATFFNHYEGLRTSEPGQPGLAGPPPHVLVPVVPGNGVDADSYGIEVGASLNVTTDWRVTGSYSFIEIDGHRRSSSIDTTTIPRIEGGSPRNQAQVHTSYRLPRNIELDASAYYVENLADLDVPSYIRVDLGLTWRPKPNLSLSVGVQNLLDDRHPEFGAGFYSAASEMPRTVYGQLSWQF